MFALTFKAALAPVQVRVPDRKTARSVKRSPTQSSRSSVPRNTRVVLTRASSESDGPSRRELIAVPGLAAFLSAAVPTEQLWLPGSAMAAAGGIKPIVPPVNSLAGGYDAGIAGAKIGPIGGAFPCTDYKAFEQVIYGFIDEIKTGDCPPQFKDATRAFLLKEDGLPKGQNPKVMLTVLTPESSHKAGLEFFINEGPKANPLWDSPDILAFRDTSGPFTATASTAQGIRGVPAKSIKGKWFGQYNLGWNGKFDEWLPGFLSQDADDFHNSLGVEFSVVHTMDTKSPGNTYKPKAKTGIEVFHCFNSLAGAQELGKAFNPDSPFFAGESRYVGPYDATIWKIMDDIDYTA